jgi:hypothetical protein
MFEVAFVGLPVRKFPFTIDNIAFIELSCVLRSKSYSALGVIVDVGALAVLLAVLPVA